MPWLRHGCEPEAKAVQLGELNHPGQPVGHQEGVGMRGCANGVPGGGEFLQLTGARSAPQVAEEWFGWVWGTSAHVVAGEPQPTVVELLPSPVDLPLPLEPLLSASIGTHSPISLW
jgi:hypothetical protein